MLVEKVHESETARHRRAHARALECRQAAEESQNRQLTRCVWPDGDTSVLFEMTWFMWLAPAFHLAAPFLLEEKRKVAGDRAVSLRGGLYEVDAVL